MKKKTSDQLEDEGVLEICAACNSTGLIDSPTGDVVCGSCGAKNFTKEVREDEYEPSE